MGNRKKNKQKNRQNSNTNANTEVLNTEVEKKETEDKITAEEQTEEKEFADETIEEQEKNGIVADNTIIQNESEEDESLKETVQEEILEKEISNKEVLNKEDLTKKVSNKDIIKKETAKKETADKQSAKTNADTIQNEEHLKERNRKQSASKESSRRAAKTVTDISSEQPKEALMNVAKILLPIAACVIVIVAVISFVSSRKSQTVALDVENGSDTSAAVTLSDEPLAENAYTDVNELMRAFYTALADGDIDTIKALKDYNTDREIITYEKKSEFIESYDNVKCYTKPGIADDSYFVYATYDVKIKDIATEAPGLNAFYVYTADDGSLKIDGDTEENIKAAFKLVTSQDDVVDLYNKIDVNYNEATASDAALDQFMTDLPKVIKESVGVALAQLETQDENPAEPAQTEESQPAETEIPAESGQPLQNQVVNQIVRTTDTVNVRSSDSEEADKIGKAQAGTELRRTEERINGWSKVIFEDREAYIKSDYLEVVTTEAAAESAGTVTATTNVNVRSQASQDSERLGSAPAGSSYNLLEDQGEWYKIDYNGTTGYVKAEFFTR